MHRKFLSFFLLTFSTLNCFSQDAFFSNTSQSLIWLNPSFAGTNGFVREQSVFRAQDLNERIPFRIFYSSLDFYIKPLNGGLAFTYVNDNQNKGYVKSHIPSITYAQQIYTRSKKMKIIPSMQLAYVMKSTDQSNLKLHDTLDYRRNYRFDAIPAEVLPLRQKSYVDIGASLLLQTKNLTAGLSFFHLNQPDEGIDGTQKLPYKINLHGAYNFKLTSELNLSLFGLFTSQGDFKDSNINCNLSWNKEVFFGLGLRKSDAVIANVGFQADAFRLTLAYDHGFGTNTNIYGKRTFEIAVGLNFTSTLSENLPSAEWLTW